MRIVAFSDLHLANYTKYSTINPKTGFNSRLIEGIDILKRIREYCLGQKIDTVLFCGDLLDNSSKIQPDLLELLIGELFMFKQWGISFICLAGQHDYYALNGEINGIKPFQDYIIPIWNVTNLIIDQKYNFIFCPHKKNIELQKKALAYAETFKMRSVKNILVGHFLVKEILEKDGVNFKIDAISLEEDVHNVCNYYFFGDYHKHVAISEFKFDSLAISIGLPLQHNWRDKGAKCGFMDFDLDNGTYTYINNLESPQFIEIRDVDKFPQEYEDNNYYRIFIEDKKEEDRIRELIDDTWHVDFVYEGMEVVNNKEEGERIEGIEFTMHPKDIIGKYGEFMEIKEDLLKAGMKYINKGE